VALRRNCPKKFPMIFLTVIPDGTHPLPKRHPERQQALHKHVSKAPPLGPTLCLAWLLSASNAQGLLNKKYRIQHDILRSQHNKGEEPLGRRMAAALAHDITGIQPGALCYFFLLHDDTVECSNTLMAQGRMELKLSDAGQHWLHPNRSSSSAGIWRRI
jgi:hypothetical protein